MKEVDKAVRIAKMVAITAGICSSDENEEFDASEFVDGLTGKMKKKINEYISGIHAGETMCDNVRVPCVFFPQKYSGEFSDGNYVGTFEIGYDMEGDENGFNFRITTTLYKVQKEQRVFVLDDKSSYEIHVKSFSGEQTSLDKTSNAIILKKIGEYALMTLLNGEAIIDEFGVDALGADASKEKTAKDNHDFIFEGVEKMTDAIKKKINSWLESKKIISTLWFDFGNKINQLERGNGEEGQQQ